jgi:hypothetical protein
MTLGQDPALRGVRAVQLRTGTPVPCR